MKSLAMQFQITHSNITNGPTVRIAEMRDMKSAHPFALEHRATPNHCARPFWYYGVASGTFHRNHTATVFVVFVRIACRTQYTSRFEFPKDGELDS